MPEAGDSLTRMSTYPDIQRLSRPDVAYAGELAAGRSRQVGGGLLTQVSGLPVLIPLTPLRATNLLRRP